MKPRTIILALVFLLALTGVSCARTAVQIDDLGLITGPPAFQRHTTLATIIAAVGAVETTVIINAPITAITQTVPITLQLEFTAQGELSVNAGQLVTFAESFAEQIKAPYTQHIFTGLGEVFSTLACEFPIGWWGAVGDNVTASNAAFQAAIDAAEATYAANIIRANYLYDAPVVVIPGGSFLVTGLTVTRQITIQGLGMETSFVRSATNATIFAASMAGTANYQPVIFKDFAITGNSTLAAQHAIVSLNDGGANLTVHTRLDHMLISWVGGDGFRSTAGNTNEVLYSKIQNNGGRGIFFTGNTNTNCHIIGNVIRQNNVGMYILPTAGWITTGFILNNLFESNIGVAGDTWTNSSQLGGANRPGIGLWLHDVQAMVIADNYFENHLNDIYGSGTVSFNVFRNNYHGNSDNAPGVFAGWGGPARQRQDVTIVGGTGNQFIRNRYTRPTKPVATADADWGTVYAVPAGTITNVTDALGGLTHVAAVTLTAGDVAAMGLVAGDWIHITAIVGTIGTDATYGLNGHDFQIVGIQGEVLAIEPAYLTGLAYVAAGTAQAVTTWTNEYAHIAPGTRATINDGIWQSPSGANQQIILPYGVQQHTTNVSTEVSGALTNYRNSGPQNMVWGGYRTASNMWYGTNFRYFAYTAADATHRHYSLAGQNHDFRYTEVDISGEPTGVATAIIAFTISEWGLEEDHVNQAMVLAGAVSMRTPGTTVDTTAPGAIAITIVPGGNYIGHTKVIKMIGDGGDATLTVSFHEAGNPTVFIFNDVGDSLTLIWTGTDWETLKARGV